MLDKLIPPYLIIFWKLLKLYLTLNIFSSWLCWGREMLLILKAKMLLKDYIYTKNYTKHKVFSSSHSDSTVQFSPRAERGAVPAPGCPLCPLNDFLRPPPTKSGGPTLWLLLMFYDISCRFVAYNFSKVKDSLSIPSLLRGFFLVIHMC